jgi:hypothetical protein
MTFIDSHIALRARPALGTERTPNGPCSWCAGSVGWCWSCMTLMWTRSAAHSLRGGCNPVLQRILRRRVLMCVWIHHVACCLWQFLRVFGRLYLARPCSRRTRRCSLAPRLNKTLLSSFFQFSFPFFPFPPFPLFAAFGLLPSCLTDGITRPTPTRPAGPRQSPPAPLRVRRMC